MATIRCIYPDKLGTHIKDMYLVTTTTGKDLTTDMANQLLSLKDNWQGTDAAVHITNLSTTYNAILDNIYSFQKLIVDFSNKKVRPLQQHIVNYCEPCEVIERLHKTIIDKDISQKALTKETIVKNSFEYDVYNVKQNVINYQKFITDIEVKKNTFLNNLLEGCDIGEFNTTYNTLRENALEYKTKLEQISTALETVLKSAKTVMKNDKLNITAMKSEEKLSEIGNMKVNEIVPTETKINTVTMNSQTNLSGMKTANVQAVEHTESKVNTISMDQQTNLSGINSTTATVQLFTPNATKQNVQK